MNILGNPFGQVLKCLVDVLTVLGTNWEKLTPEFVFKHLYFGVDSFKLLLELKWIKKITFIAQ